MRPHGWGSSTRRQRLPKDWPEIRRRILWRDSGICHVCHEPGADQVDHVVAGDDHREMNLASIHQRPCHLAKTIAEREGRRPRAKRAPEPHPGLI